MRLYSVAKLARGKKPKDRPTAQEGRAAGAVPVMKVLTAGAVELMGLTTSRSGVGPLGKRNGRQDGPRRKTGTA
eukprot:967803-Amphidinium_carterae.1